MSQTEIPESASGWLTMTSKKQIEIAKLGKKVTVASPITLYGETRKSRVFKEIKIYPSDNQIHFSVRGRGQLLVSSNNILDHTQQHTTILADGKIKIFTPEHILSSLYGMGIDCARVEVENEEEIPIFDHSARLISEAIKRVGIKNTGKDKEIVYIRETIFYHEKDGSMAILRPSTKTKRVISVLIQYDYPIGEQYFCFKLTKKSYFSEIAWARSFIRRSCNKGVWQKCIKEIPSLPSRLEDSPIPVFRNGKWITPVKKPDEPVRHKILDLLGDLAILGRPIYGHITVVRPGHNFNCKLVRYLDQLLKS